MLFRLLAHVEQGVEGSDRENNLRGRVHRGGIARVKLDVASLILGLGG